MFNVNIDYAVTLALTVVLSIKYIFFDNGIDAQQPVDPNHPAAMLDNERQDPITQSELSGQLRESELSR